MADWKTNKDLVQKLYVIFYGRPADPGGLKHWAEQLPDNAKPDSPEVKQLITRFINSEEARARFGNPEIQYTITRLILYGFQRDITEQEISALKDKPIEDIIVSLLNPTDKEDFLTLEKKVTYANAFVRMLDPNEDGLPNDGVNNSGFVVTYFGNKDAEGMASKLFLVNEKAELSANAIFQDIKQAIGRPTDLASTATKPEEVPALVNAKVVEKVEKDIARVEVIGNVINKVNDISDIEKVREKLNSIDDVNKIKAVGNAISTTGNINNVNDVLNKIDNILTSPTTPTDNTNTGSGSTTGGSTTGGGSTGGGSTGGGGGSSDTTAPTITEFSVSQDGWYKAGDHIDFTVKFSENVVVNTTNGKPRIEFKIGDDTKYAEYHSGSGTNTLVFRYTVENNLEDRDGISLVSNSINLNNGTIKDGAGNNAVLNFNPVSVSGIKIDSKVPTITDLALDEADDTGLPGDNLTNKNTVTIKGKVDTDVNTVKLFKGSSEVASAVVDSGNFTLSNISLTVGDNVFTVKATDEAGNTKESTITVKYDNQAPTLHTESYFAVTDVDNDGNYSAGDRIHITFSEPVAGFSIGDIQVSSGKTLGTNPQLVQVGTIQNGYASVYEIVLGSGANVAVGDKLTIPSNKVKDIAGNPADSDIEVTLIPISGGSQGQREFADVNSIKKMYIGSLVIEADRNFTSEISTDGLSLYKDGTQAVTPLPQSFSIDNNKATLNVNLSDIQNWVLFKYDGTVGNIKFADNKYVPSINAVVSKAGNSTIDLTQQGATSNFGSLNDNYYTVIFGSNGDNIIKLDGAKLQSSMSKPTMIFTEGDSDTDTVELNMVDSSQELNWVIINGVRGSDIIKAGAKTIHTQVQIAGDWIATTDTVNNGQTIMLTQDINDTNAYNVDLSNAEGSSGWWFANIRPKEYLKGSNQKDMFQIDSTELRPVASIEGKGGNDMFYVTYRKNTVNGMVFRLDNFDGGEGNDAFVIWDVSVDNTLHYKFDLTDAQNGWRAYHSADGTDWTEVAGSLKNFEVFNAGNANTGFTIEAKAGSVSEIITGNYNDTITIQNGGTGQVVIDSGRGNDLITLSSDSTVEKIIFTPNNTAEGLKTIVNFGDSDKFVFYFSEITGIYDADSNTNGIQHILAGSTGEVNVSGKVAVVYGSYEGLNSPEEIAQLFGQGKALSFTSGSTILITAYSDTGKEKNLNIILITSNDSTVDANEVKFIGSVSLINDYTDGYLTADNFQLLL